MKILEKLKKNRAFSIAETMLMVSIIGVLLAFFAKSISRVTLDSDLVKFKKTYSDIEETVNYLVNHEIIYGTAAGFQDTTPVTIEEIGEVIGQSNATKFRDAFKYHVHCVEDNINCPIYGGESSSGCFKTDFGVVMGIPDTDFIKMGITTVKDYDNQDITVVPITFYTNYQTGQTIDDNAFIVGITYDGKIHFKYSINKSNCTKSSNSKKMQCKLKEYIQAASTKKSVE